MSKLTIEDKAEEVKTTLKEEVTDDTEDKKEFSFSRKV